MVLPWGIAVDQDGNIYVADEKKHQLLVFSAGGDLITTIGKHGTKPGDFQFPLNLALGAMGISMSPIRTTIVSRSSRSSVRQAERIRQTMGWANRFAQPVRFLARGPRIRKPSLPAPKRDCESHGIPQRAVAPRWEIEGGKRIAEFVQAIAGVFVARMDTRPGSVLLHGAMPFTVFSHEPMSGAAIADHAAIEIGVIDHHRSVEFSNSASTG